MKKILETSMLLYQYSYYMMRVWDEKLRLPKLVTQTKIFAVYMVVELFGLLTVCIIVHRIIFGHTFVNANLPNPATLSFIIGAIAYILVTTYLNNKILGSDRRIEHYKKIFDAWDKWKHRRWSFYVSLIMILIFAVLFIADEVDHENHLNPKDWIDDIINS